MDKYEFNIKVEQLKKLVKMGDYSSAMQIADNIDWRRVHNTVLLSIVSEVYEKNEEYGEAKEILLLAYERAPIGKRLLFRLTSLAIKEGSISEAEAYYREFYDIAPEDSRGHILRYMILKAKNAPIDQLIHSLEAYTYTELDEKWMYELAELYHAAGRSEDCIRVCDNIMLMFGLGKYVDKAIELKTQKEGVELTEYQQGLIDNREHYEEKLREVEETYASGYVSTDSSFMNADDKQESEEEEVNQEEYSTNEELEDEEEIIDKTGEESVNEDIFVQPQMQGIDSQIEAHMKELEEQEKLKTEILNMDNVLPVEENELEKTKVLANIKSAISIEEVMEPKKDEVIEDIAIEESFDSEVEVLELDEDKNDESKNLDAIVLDGKTSEEALSKAITLIKDIHQTIGRENQVLKIKAGKLNERGVLNSRQKISGKDLIIEEAGDLTVESIKELIEVLNSDDIKRTIILLDNPMQLKKMVLNYPDIRKEFDIPENIIEETNSAITDISLHVKEEALAEEDAASEYLNKKDIDDISEMREKKAVKKKDSIEKEARRKAAYAMEELDIDEFADYACEHARRIDCSITGKSMLALYERIEIMDEDGIPLTRANAEALIEEAADKAEKPPIMKRIFGIFSPKYNRDGLLILKEEHFIS